MSNKLIRGMYDVLVANVVNLLTSAITTLILPKFLSIDTYALLKSYQLYINCTAILQFGYVDGMYLKYGGRNVSDIDKKEWNETVSTLRIFQLFFTAIGCAIALYAHSILVFLVAIVIMPISVTGLLKQFYQAVGEFKEYKFVMILNTVFVFLANMAILFVMNSDNGYVYLIAYDVIYILLWLLLETQIKRKCSSKIFLLAFDMKKLIAYVKSGILLTFGNYSSYILISMDRWFIKFLLDNFAFAQYSFAASLEGFLTVAVTPITITLYNFFCKESDMGKIRRMRNIVMIFSSGLVASAFGVKFIIRIWLLDYMDSINVIFILFASHFFYTLNKGIYVNLYKSGRKQKLYFKRLLMVIVIGFFANVGIYTIYKGYMSFAIGTLLSSMFWLMLSVNDFKECYFAKKELIYMSGVLTLFLLCGFLLNPIVGFAVYVVCVFSLTALLLRNDGWALLEIAKEKFSSLGLVK